MRVRRVVRWAVVAVIIVLTFALFTDLFGGQLIRGLPMIEFTTVERFATSSITLESMREVSELATVRYHHRAVFPYDYLPRDVSLPEILRRLRASNRQPDEILTADEQRYLRTYQLASDINLSVTGGTFDFVVVTLVISAGFAEGSGVREIVIEEVPVTTGTVRRATVALAPPVILEVGVEDIDPDDYPYPDTSLSAEAWRRVAEYVRERAVPAGTERRILDAARENGELFIARVLRQAGFDEVRFVAEGAE